MTHGGASLMDLKISLRRNSGEIRILGGQMKH